MASAAVAVALAPAPRAPGATRPRARLGAPVHMLRSPAGLGRALDRPRGAARLRATPRVRAGAAEKERTAVMSGAKPKAAVANLLRRSPFAAPFLRSFATGVKSALAFEAVHSAAVMTGLLGRVGFTGLMPALLAGQRGLFQPLWGTDHVVGFAGWVASYMFLAAAVSQRLERERRATAPERAPAAASPLHFRGDEPGHVAEGPSVSVLPPAGARRATTPGARPGTLPPPPPPPTPAPEATPVTPTPPPARLAALSDRHKYLKNFWYAAALSERVTDKPHLVEMLDLRLVLFRDSAGTVHALPDACPHRGAPLSAGWVAQRGGADCVVCPYHGWAVDAGGHLRDVPANADGERLPQRPVLQPASVTERGGFVWLFYGDANLPADARPPLPLIPELEDAEWQPVYGEFEFNAPHTSVFENAIDFAHVHYLHSGSFGNTDAPAVRNMRAEADAYGVRSSFTIQNKPVSWLWEWSRVPEVHVQAQALLPSTSVVAFELAFGVSMITFVNTVPISATKSVNRFALVRNFSRKLGPAPLQAAVDGFARQAMVRILTEDRTMVEQLRPADVAHEVNVRADAAQLQFRKLRQAYVSLGYGVTPKGACGEGGSGGGCSH